MMIISKHRLTMLMTLLCSGLLLFSESSSGDGIDGIVGKSSSGNITLYLQITRAGALVGGPETPRAMTPEFIIRRLESAVNWQSRPDLALCIVSPETHQYEIDTVFLDDAGKLRRAPAGVQAPYSIAVGSANSKADSARLRSVSEARCSSRNALLIFLVPEQAVRRPSGAVGDRFKLLLKAE